MNFIDTLDKTRRADTDIYKVYSKYWEIKNHLDFLGLNTDQILDKLREEVRSYEPFILTHF